MLECFYILTREKEKGTFKNIKSKENKEKKNIIWRTIKSR